ncbi:MAG: A24 family peptidase [Candidatus Nucleicultricaceae bacterium]
MQFLNALFVITSLIAAIYDFLYYKIPNLLVGILFAIFVAGALIFAPFSSWVLPETILLPILMFLSVIVVGFILFRFGLMGAGDVKLLAVMSAWAYSQNSLIMYWVIVSVIGGILGVVYLQAVEWINAVRVRLSLLFKRLLNWPVLSEKEASNNISSFGKSKTIIPYGVAISCGALVLILMKMGHS